MRIPARDPSRPGRLSAGFMIAQALSGLGHEGIDTLAGETEASVTAVLAELLAQEARFKAAVPERTREFDDLVATARVATTDEEAGRSQRHLGPIEEGRGSPEGEGRRRGSPRRV